MQLINIIDEDILNYKKISMFIGLPYCSGKCWKELGLDSSICQNDQLRQAAILDISNTTLINRFLANPLSEAVVFGGMEPFESFNDLYSFIEELRKLSDCDVVVYTGFNKEEITQYTQKLKIFPNIIIKYGRYIPNRLSHHDEILGVDLISDNQYAEKIS